MVSTRDDLLSPGRVLVVTNSSVVFDRAVVGGGFGAVPSALPPAQPG